MSNYITASVEFYYKGEKIAASIELDLESHMQASGKMPVLYPLLAQSINLDLYSYEYEMMLAEIITFSQAKGLVSSHVSDGTLDIDAFEAAWSEDKTLSKLQKIAQQNLSINDLDKHPELKNALMDAYRLGEETKTPKIF